MAGNQGSNSGNASNNSANNGNQGGFESGGSQSGTNGQQQGGFESAGGQAGSGDDPFADLSEGRGQVMTSAQRRAALDERLNEGFAEFDGMILGERERVQAQADEAGSDVMSAGGGGGNGGEGDSAGFEPLVIASAPDGSTGGGILIGEASRQGDFDNTQEESFPVPDDIPLGANDDVVARQLREAAMREPDPELREALWDEYRAYTGLSTE